MQPPTTLTVDHWAGGQAADGLVDGAFYNAGQVAELRPARHPLAQSCCGVQRVYVDRAVYDQFLVGAGGRRCITCVQEKSLAITKGYKLGDPMQAGTTLGPLAQPRTAMSLSTFVRG